VTAGARLEVTRIADQLARAHEGNAWHGPSLDEVLAGVTAEQAAARPIPNAHTIWEIVHHLAAWEDIVRQRLEGALTIDVTPEVDWPPVADTSPEAWERAHARLADGHRRLQRTLAGMKDADLAKKTPKGTSYYGLAHGVIQHGLYHAGQIALLRKG
jgi:uncharacterized damage-inducible protein DinB